VQVQNDPIEVADAKAAPAGPATRRHLVTPGETLADIAREMAPDDTEGQDRIVRAIIVLNPQLFSSRPANDVPAGTELLLPDASAGNVAAPTVVASAPLDANASPQKHKHAKRSAKGHRGTHLAGKHRAPAGDASQAPTSLMSTDTGTDAATADARRARADTKRTTDETARIAAGGVLEAPRSSESSGSADTRREGNYRFSLTLSHIDPAAVAHPVTPAQKRARDEANDDDRQATVLALRDQIKSLQGEIAKLQQELGRPAKVDGNVVPGPVPMAPAAPVPAPVPAVRVEAERIAPPAEPPKVATQLPHPPKHKPLPAPPPPRDWTDGIWSTFARLGLPLGAAGILGLALLYYRRRKNAQDNVYIEPVASVPTLTAETIAPAAPEPTGVRKPAPLPGDAATVTESALEFIPPPPPPQDDASRDQRRAYIAERFPEVAAGVIELHDVEAIVEASRQYFEGDGDTDKALELLEFSIADDPSQLKLWLAEFEILRRSNRTPGFDKLATRYRLQFGENEHWRTICSVGLELDPENRTFQAGAAVPEESPDEWAAHGVDPVDAPEPERHENWLNAPLDFTPELLANDLRDSLLADFQEEENSRPTKDSKVLSLAPRGEDQAVNG
jgi:hypothetical protein